MTAQDIAEIEARAKRAADEQRSWTAAPQVVDDVRSLIGEVRAHRDRAARIRALEVEARAEYEAVRADESASVSDLVGAEARVVALATAADIAEGVVI